MHDRVSAQTKRAEGVPGRVDELDALYRLTDRLFRATSVVEVYDAALDAILATLGRNRAAILLFDQDGVMRFAAWRGLSEAYRRAVEGHSPWKADDREPQPIFVGDVEDAPEIASVKTAVRREGIRALAFIPLIVD